MQSPKERNDIVTTEILALIQKIWYGHIDLSLDIHNGRITKMEAKTSKKVLYDPKQEEKPLKDILLECKTKPNSLINLELVTTQSKIKTISYENTLTRNYDQLDES